MSLDSSLPVKNSLAYIYWASFLIAILTMAGSISGFLYRDQVYPSEELVTTFVPNDVVNLSIGLPILLGSMWVARQNKLMGLLFWTGALFFGVYNSIAYVYALPVSWIFLLHLTLVALGVYTLIALVARIQGEAVRQRLRGAVHEKISAGVVLGFGILFLLRVFLVIGGAIINGEALARTEMAPNISDFLIAPAFIVVGIALWKEKALGYVGGLGLLFQASMLFVGLILFMLLQPLLTTASFAAIDVLIVSAMGLICFVPFGLFIHGVVRSGGKGT